MADQSKQVCLSTSSGWRQLTVTPSVSRSGEIVHMQIISREKTAQLHADIPACCLLHDAMYQDDSEKKVQTGATFECLLEKWAQQAGLMSFFFGVVVSTI